MKTLEPRTSEPVVRPPSAWREGRVTRPGDALEREADRMAERALTATADGPASTSSRAPAGTVMRQASDYDRRLVEYDDDAFDIPAASRSSSPPAPPAGFLGAVRSSGGGRPLAGPVRDRMEQGFGRGFEDVRVHADSESARLSDAIRARAFVHGRDVFFDRGEFQPGTAEGDRLIAHELAHTLQQPGAGTVARQPADPKLGDEPVDVSTMTPEQKRALRTQISGLAARQIGALEEQFKQDRSFDAAKHAAWLSAVGAAIANARNITDPRQREVRLGYLRREREALNDPFYAWLRARGILTLGGGVATLELLGDPNRELPAENLEDVATWIPIMAGGTGAYLRWLREQKIYREKGIDPELLAEPEPSGAGPGGGAAPEPSGGGPAPEPSGPGPGGGPAQAPPTSAPAVEQQLDPSGAIGGTTLEHRALLEELYSSLGEFDTEAASGDPDQLAEELAKLTPEQRKDFYEFARRIVESSAGPGDRAGGAAKTLAELLEMFNKLDPASREALTVNRELAEADPGADDALPERVLLKLTKEAGKTRTAVDNARTVQSNLDLLRSVTQDPEAQRKMVDLDFLGVSPFLNELAMLHGLLAGAGERSPLVRDVGKELLKEIDRVRDHLSRELLWLAGESTAMAALAAGTGGAASPALLRVLWRIKKVKDLIEKLEGIYKAGKRVKEIIDRVVDTGKEFDKFRARFEAAMETYTRIEAQLEQLDAPEDLEYALAEQEEKLLAELDKELDGRLGGLLELMYIPEDTPPEELRQILFEIPRGITSLEAMWTYYDSGDKTSEHFADVLAIKAFKAGTQLYPLVGLMAALIAEELQAAFPERSVEDRINKWISKSKRGKPKEREERNRGLFGRLRRENYDYAEADLKPHVTWAKEQLSKAIDPEEEGSGSSEHWAPAWFKTVVRRQIKEVNKRRTGRTVRATRKTKTTGGATPAPENIPLPPFSVRLKKIDTRGKLAAVIKINSEETLEVDSLSNADFAGKGIEFAGTAETRQDAIRKWLWDAGYEIVRDNADKEHIRLPGGRRESTDQSYLHFDGGRIKAGIDKSAYKAFLGRLVVDSRDLPEGYHLSHQEATGHNFISRKAGVAGTEYQPLGLDANHKLAEGSGTAPPKEVAAPGVIKPTGTQPYDYKAAISAMFASPQVPGKEYNTQGRTRKWWTERVEGEDALKTRPTEVSGKLGYVVRAPRGALDPLPELQDRDDKGHLVAARFGGVDLYDNLVPMLTSANRPPGRWYDFESDMAAVYVGKKAKPGHYVKFDLSLIYPTDERKDKTRRPSQFVAKYQEKTPTGGDEGAAQTRTVDND